MLNAYETSGTSPTSTRKIKANSWGHTTDNAVRVAVGSVVEGGFIPAVSSRRKRWNDGVRAELNFEVNKVKYLEGTLRSWHHKFGFGLVMVSRHEVYFLHISQILHGPEIPEPGAIVYFQPEAATRGRCPEQAVDAIIVEKKSAEVSQ